MLRRNCCACSCGVPTMVGAQRHSTASGARIRTPHEMHASKRLSEAVITGEVTAIRVPSHAMGARGEFWLRLISLPLELKTRSIASSEFHQNR